MALSWGYRREIEEEVKEQHASDRAQNKRTARELQDQSDELERRKVKFDADKQLQSDLDTQRKQLEAGELDLKKKQLEVDNFNKQSQFEKDKAKFELDKEVFEMEKSDMNRQISNAKEDTEVAVNKAVAEKEAEMIEKQSSLREQVESSKADSSAKDQVIEAKDSEIKRLDELLKVTMAKLTQIDIKGLTIHVDAASNQQKGGQKPEGKQEGK